MKKQILKNIAIVSAIFIVTLSIMLIVNYFQVRETTPLQTGVLETLKEINDQNATNHTLQEQIRQLDLLARKAYFVRSDHLMVGVYILLGMLAVFIVCTRLYFAREKDIPDKNIDPIDEWAIKTKARKHIVWIASGIAVIALVFATLAGQGEAAVGQGEAAMQQGEAAARQGEAAMQQGGTGEVGEALDRRGVLHTPIIAEAVDTTENNKLSPPLANESKESEKTSVASNTPHNAFRGNNSNGVSSAKSTPVAWDLNNMTNIAWKQEIPRKGYNSPVINGNKVFFSGADEEARELYCYDLNTGEKLWSLVAANIPGSPKQLPETTEDTGFAASSVATNGNQVCAIFATGDLICADMDGKQLWAKNLGVPDNHYGYASSLLIFGNLVIVQYDNRNAPSVMAFDIATGAERWKKNRKEKMIWSSPTMAYINNTPHLILMGNPAITAYNPNNGQELWRVECMTGEIGASACSANNIVFGASEYAKLVAINGADGSILWDDNNFLPEIASPAATKDNLYLATSYGMVVSYHTQTGELRKEHELGEEFYSSPMIVDGKVYLFSTSGKMHIFSADDEFRLLTAFDTGEKTYATPAFTDGKIVVRTEQSIYCAVNQ